MEKTLGWRGDCDPCASRIRKVGRTDHRFSAQRRKMMSEPQNPIEWVSGTLLFRQPNGHNDVWWCHGVNGPVVVLGNGNVCSRCGQRLVDDPHPHSFVAHVELKKK